MKSLQEILGNYIQACFSGLWIETREPDEAVREIRELGKNHERELGKNHEWQIGVWDIDNGLTSEGLKNATSDPVETIKNWGSQADQETPKLLILRNLHRFLKTADIIQVLENQIQKGKSTRTYFIVLAPATDIPLELQKLFRFLETCPSRLNVPIRHNLAAGSTLAALPGFLQRPPTRHIITNNTFTKNLHKVSTFFESPRNMTRDTTQPLGCKKPQIISVIFELTGHFMKGHRTRRNWIRIGLFAVQDTTLELPKTLANVQGKCKRYPPPRVSPI